MSVFILSPLYSILNNFLIPFRHQGGGVQPYVRRLSIVIRDIVFFFSCAQRAKELIGLSKVKTGVLKSL